jgi:excisionase family DNA binding protein
MSTATLEYGQPFVAKGPEEYLDKREAAKLLGVSPRTIENFIYSGKLRASRPTRKVVRIKRSDIDAMLDRFATTAA